MANITYTNEVLDAYSGQINCEAGIYLNQEIIGVVEYVLYDEELTVSNIFIRPEFRRQGYGSRLMKYIKQQNPNYKYKSSMKTDLGSAFKHKDISIYENKFISFNNWIFEEEKEEAKENSEEPRYGCIMMDANIKNWKEYHTSGIDEKDVYIKPYDKSYGLEETPHITIVYGIHEEEVDPQRMADLIEYHMKPITLVIDEIGVFEGDEYDVVKYNIPITGQLRKYRDLFLQIPNTQSFPDYHPHMTIAYVKPGEGKKYATKLKEPFKVDFTKGVYSWHPDKEEDLDKTSRKVVNLIKKDASIGMHESINFERGIGPKESMKIGLTAPRKF